MPYHMSYTTQQCPSCKQIYAGQVCVDCFVESPDVDEEDSVSSYLKNLKYNVVSAFGKIKGKKTSVDIIDDLTAEEDFEDFFKVKEKMINDMMNHPQPKRLSNKPVISPNSRFHYAGGPIGATVDVNLESDLEQEKRLEQEKPTLKVFEIHVWFNNLYEHGDSDRVDREIRDIIIMLSEDLDTVGEQVSKEFGYEELGHTLEIKEVKGPFKSGSILSKWDDF